MAGLPHATSVRVLSIDGGGMKGYTSLLILQRILRAMKVEAKKEGIDLADELTPCDVFDLIVGTSTGGLIAIMLGRLHMTVDQCIEQYEVLGKKVFGKTQWADQTGRLFKGMLKRPFYDIKTLQKAVQSVIRLQEIKAQEEDFKETSPTCKTIVCVTRSKTAAPDVLRNYESQNSTQASYRCKIGEAASAPAAAPLFFEPVKLQAGGEIWRDGGLRRNNPINVALQQLELEPEWKDKRIGCVLSLGTGAPKIQEISDNLAKFLKGSVDMMTDSEDIAEEFASSKEGQELARSQRYFRFSVAHGMEDLQMDECEETERIEALTDGYLGKVGSGVEVDRCAKSLLLPDQNWGEKPKEKPDLLPYQSCIHFIDRETYSAELHRFFDPNIQGQRRFVLWGFGGSGKTQIALGFAHSMRNRLSVFWVRADNFANFLNDFSQIVVDGPDSLKDHENPGQDRRSMARNITSRLEQDPTSWLLVLDNADNFDQFVETTGGGDGISSYVPKTGRVLITTRDKLFQGNVTAAKHGLQVKPMDTREARELFEKSITDDLAHQSSTEVVDELLSLLGNLPLAIAQAAANITYQQRPVDKYIAAYREKENRMSLMEKPTLDLQTEDSRTSHQSILVTYEMSFEYLEKNYPESARCLNYFGFFNWQRIPEPLIRAIPQLRGLDEQSFCNTMNRLHHLSMVEVTPISYLREYSVHPVIHERISERLSLEAKMSYLSDSIAVMSSLFTLGDDSKAKRPYVIGQYLHPHALLQFDLATSIGLNTKELALLYSHCAKYLADNGMASHSISFAEQAISVGREVWGPDSTVIVELYIKKPEYLVRSAQYQEGYDDSIAAIELLESVNSQNETMSSQSYCSLRGMILGTRLAACHCLGKIKEIEEIRNELTHLQTIPGTSDIYQGFMDRLIAIEDLLEQGRLQEARRANSELLNSMNEQQRSVGRETFLSGRLQNARILQGIRDGSHAEPAAILADEEERAILTIFQDVFRECRATFLIAKFTLWASCTYLLNELLAKSEAREAADVLISMLTEAVQSELHLEGLVAVSFTKTLLTGFRVIDSLHETVDARQGPPGLSIAELFVQIMNRQCTACRKRWNSVYLVHLSELFSMLGNFPEVENSLREALRHDGLDKDRRIEITIHCRLVLAIARQGRNDDARRHMDMFLALIGSTETTQITLDELLRQDRTEKELYDEAKDILAGRHRKVPESWWTRNRIALNKAQLRYGCLEPVAAEENLGSIEGASTSASKGQKGKSRR